MQRKESSISQSVLRSQCNLWPGRRIFSKPHLLKKHCPLSDAVKTHNHIFFHTALCDAWGWAICFFLPYSTLLHSFPPEFYSTKENTLSPWIVNMDVLAATIRNFLLSCSVRKTTAGDKTILTIHKSVHGGSNVEMSLLTNRGLEKGTSWRWLRFHNGHLCVV